MMVRKALGVAVRVGDVVGVVAESQPSDSTKVTWLAVSVTIIEKWDGEKLGKFEFLPPWDRQGPSVVAGDVLVAAVQAQRDVIERIRVYFESRVENSGFKFTHSLTPLAATQDRLLLVYSKQGLCGADFGRRVMTDRVALYGVSRVYVLDDSVGAPTLEGMAKLMAQKTPSSPHSIPTRLHAFPKLLFTEAIRTIFHPILPNLVFSPQTYSHVLTVVFADGFFWGSLLPIDSAPGAGVHLTPEPSDVCKAGAKLTEALERMGVWTRNLSIALDIGASPGGWSEVLAARGYTRVIAVDNGALASSLLPSVEHWRMKGEEAIQELMNAEGAMYTQKISIYTCDMNVELMETVDLFLSALPLLSAEFCAVLTLKRTARNRQVWETRKAEGMVKLKQFLPNHSVDEIHLIANTPNETCLIISPKLNRVLTSVTSNIVW